MYASKLCLSPRGCLPEWLHCSFVLLMTKFLKLSSMWISPVTLSICLQVLQKKFEDFKRDVSASTERYSAANNLARRLVAEGHSDTVLIKEKQDAMRYRKIKINVSQSSKMMYFSVIL